MCSVVGEFFGLPHGVRDAFSVTLEGRWQVRDVVGVWKVKAACNQDGLDVFLAGLLCIKAQVLEVATGHRGFARARLVFAVYLGRYWQYSRLTTGTDPDLLNRPHAREKLNPSTREDMAPSIAP